MATATAVLVCIELIECTWYCVCSDRACAQQACLSRSCTCLDAELHAISRDTTMSLARCNCDTTVHADHVQEEQTICKRGHRADACYKDTKCNKGSFHHCQEPTPLAMVMYQALEQLSDGSKRSVLTCEPDLWRCGLHLLDRQLCNGLEEELLKVMQQQHSLSLLACSCCAPNSVDVLGLVCWHPHLQQICQYEFMSSFRCMSWTTGLELNHWPMWVVHWRVCCLCMLTSD